MNRYVQSFRVHCLACDYGATVSDFRVGVTILWANQYGYKLRVFCHHCGAVHDIKIMNDGRADAFRRSFRVDVRGK